MELQRSPHQSTPPMGLGLRSIVSRTLLLQEKDHFMKRGTHADPIVLLTLCFYSGKERISHCPHDVGSFHKICNCPYKVGSFLISCECITLCWFYPTLGAKKDIVFEECSDLVSSILHEDVMKSVKFMVEALVAKVIVLLYQGLFDLRDGVVSTEAWIEKMNWEGLKCFLLAERKVWKVKGEFSGYVQRWGKLSHVVVAGAGHLVPADQGLHSQSMIEEWVLEEGYFGDGEGAACLGMPSQSTFKETMIQSGRHFSVPYGY